MSRHSRKTEAVIRHGADWFNVGKFPDVLRQEIKLDHLNGKRVIISILEVKK